MSTTIQIVAGFVIIAFCAIGATVGGIMVKNGFENKKINIKSSKVNIQDSTLNNSPTIVDSPGASVSLDIPEPKFDIKVLSESVLTGELYKSEFEINITTKVPINNLYLEARAATITDLQINPLRTGMVIFGHSGKRNGYGFTNIPNAYGKYKIIAFTKEKEQVKVNYDYK